MIYNNRLSGENVATTYELRIYGIEQNPPDFVTRSYASETQHVGFRDKIENLGWADGIDERKIG
ncbi:MAG: hypothetical protein PWP15_100 [Methanothermococcus sp.]|jgi:hypothetical protein|nr:hypothetical protein [Methanothermococcus sp.]MDK2988170.1 hypothetical protein [Methanothermococcus sp.]